MTTVQVYNLNGEVVGDLALAEDVFAVPMNEALLHQSVVRYLANRRIGSANTKTRSEVSGGGRKPWRQKGTGRARVGTIRSPLWRHGGITFGPKPRSFSKNMPRKMRRSAVRIALSEKVRQGALVVVDNWDPLEPKTREMARVMTNLQAGKALIVTADRNEIVERSARNIPGIKLITVAELNAYDILGSNRLILAQDAVHRVEEVLS